MSTRKQAKETKNSFKSDKHGAKLNDSQTAKPKSAGSMIAEPDYENYQDLHGAKVDTAILDVKVDFAHDLSAMGASFSEIVQP